MLELQRHDGLGAGQPRLVLHEVRAEQRGAAMMAEIVLGLAAFVVAVVVLATLDAIFNHRGE